MTGSLFPSSTCESGLGEALESKNGFCFLNSLFFSLFLHSLLSFLYHMQAPGTLTVPDSVAD